MTFKRRRSEGGQSLVEFALLLPLMIVLLLAIIDFARIYTTMMGVESAAREAADWGANGSVRWQTATYAATRDEMNRRACVAASNLVEYQGPETACANPDFSACLTSTDGGACVWPPDPGAACDTADRSTPCKVTVTLDYDFKLLLPLNVDILGVHIGIPSTIHITRDSTFAISDLKLPVSP